MSFFSVASLYELSKGERSSYSCMYASLTDKRLSVCSHTLCSVDTIFSKCYSCWL